MFQNPLKQHQQDKDPFENTGKIEESQIEKSSQNSLANNPNYVDAQNDPDLHFVEPHYVMSHTRSDGTHVEGYWRDGDGNTSFDRAAEDGGGYLRSNPDGDLTNNLGF
ncbi:hypothetical protein BTR23_21300 [Alkalihalophilus pseudofirmus]|nr:hypothetical protein BTR23_21300 [Alkalihalophilus pseudofirmus]